MVKMQAIHAHISSWTASFRYSGFMIGIQPTLPIPPLSTVYGLLSAAAGRVITPEDTFLAYKFTSQGNTIDLERIVEVQPGAESKRNVIRREILLDCHLDLYVHPDLFESLKKPFYPILLGRSSDLASIDTIDEVELESVTNYEGYFGESIYTNPPQGFIESTLYALPIHFTDTIPRRAIGTRPFVMIPHRYHAKGNGVHVSADETVMELFSNQTLGLG